MKSKSNLILGTGKTKTLVELIKQTLCLDKASKIIVATPSNSAAYLLTEALTNSGLGREDLIRIISNNQLEKELVPDYLREFCATVGTVEHRSDVSKMLMICKLKFLNKMSLG